MDGLTSAIKRCNIHLKLDNNTEGYGNCFPNAIVQQCRRPEIRTWLQENKPWAIVSNQRTLRTKVKTFALKSRNKNLCNFKSNYEKILQKTENKTWTDYWEEMGQDGAWVDSVSVQVTAWYMGLDILILTTSSKPEHPFISVTGNIDNTSVSSTGPPLLLGNYTNVHYQSLVPLYKNMNMQYQPKRRTLGVEKENNENSKTDDFIYMHNGEQIIFHSLDTEKLQCPFCSESFQRLVSHVASKKCRISKSNIDRLEFTSQLNSFREGFRLELGRKRKQKSQTKLREEKGTEVIKAEQNQRKLKSRTGLREEKGTEVNKTEQNKSKMKSRTKLREEKGIEVIKAEQNKTKLKSQTKLRVEKGPTNIRNEQNARKEESRKRKVEDDHNALHTNEKDRKKLSRQKQKEENPRTVKEDQNKWQQKHRLVDSEKKRLMKFRKKTMFNAIFTCVCCQRNLFESNVIKFTTKLVTEIETKKHGLYDRSIEMINSSPIMVNINGTESSYICHACKTHIEGW
jgi:hypothetical protein